MVNTMAKVTGPILSMRAGGQIGKSQVYAQWRGVPYARQYAVPSNPKTTAQTSVRSSFAWLQDYFRSAPAVAQTPWFQSAKGKPVTDRNRLTQVNMPLIRQVTNVTGFLGSPGVASGPALASVSIAQSTDVAQVTVVPAALPTGWSVAQAVAVMFPQQDSHQPFTGLIIAGVDATDPYQVDLTRDPTTETTWVISAWAEYSKPDGSFAASVAVTSEFTFI